MSAHRGMQGASRKLSALGILAIALSLSQPALWAAEKQPIVRLASDVWPPFTNVSGQPRFAMELVHEALARAGVVAETSVVDWEQVMSGIRDSKFDGSAAMWRNSEREAYLRFSEPYLENRLVLVGRKGSDVDAATLAELSGKRIAVVERYAYGEALDIAGSIELDQGSSDQENLEKLLRGEVDYMLVDQLLIRYLLENQQEEAVEHLEIGTTPLVRRGLHFAIRRDFPGAEKIVEGFDAQIRNMLSDGTYNGILQLNWIQADVDGDGRMELIPRNEMVGAEPPLMGYRIVVPTEAGAPIQVSNRFYGGGRICDDWDTIPARYKVSAESNNADIPSTPIVLFRFKF
ncbi:MAG: transporter substrate-binding domain-containing protein [Acidobacteriota bacterium]